MHMMITDIHSDYPARIQLMAELTSQKPAKSSLNIMIGTQPWSMREDIDGSDDRIHEPCQRRRGAISEEIAKRPVRELHAAVLE